MARDSSVLGGAIGETLSGASVAGGTARVGRETSPFVPRQPAPLPEAKQAEAERTFTVEEPVVVPFTPPSDGGAPDGGGDAGGAPGDAGDAGAPGDAGNAGDPGAGSSSGDPF